MPILQEQAHSVATIKHVMDKVKEVTSFLNPRQAPVMACDQPLFVFAKQIQWEWPEIYGEDRFVVLFGGMHIEMAAFKLLGDLLIGTGWETTLSEPDIASLGTAESFITVSNLAKTRQAHQITACCLYDLITKAYQHATDHANPVTGNTRPPNSWNTFLRVTKTKPKFLFFLADKIVSMNTDATIVVTKEENVGSNKAIDTDFIAPCTHEEADTHMFLHAKHAAIGGSKSINIISSDTDVVVIGVAVFGDLNVDHIWMTFGKGKDLRWIPIHDIVRSLSPRSKELPFFHAFTGCDTVSAFVGKGKKTAWQAWNGFENAKEVFHCFSSPCDNLTQSEIGVLKEFVVIMYDRSSSTNKVNDARLDLFARKQSPYNGIPPSRAALVEHMKRSVLQAGHTWGQSLCISRKLYHHLPGGVGKKIAEFGSHTGHHWCQ
jgi:hypothetical protein